MSDGVDESGLDPEIRAKLRADTSERLYVYTRVTGGWFIPATPGSDAAGLGVPYDFTQLAITRSAIYWRGWEQQEVTKKGLFGRERTERNWLQAGAAVAVSDIDRVVISRDGFDPGYASEIGIPPEQHLAITVRGGNRTQTFYNWSNNSDDVMRDVAAIFTGLGVAVDDHVGVLSS